MSPFSSQALADFVAHAPLQAWCALILFGAVCLAAVVCLTVGAVMEWRGPPASMARALRQRRKARRALAFARR